MHSDVCCSILRDTSELAAFQSQWTHLWLEDQHATPFQRPEWLLPWWRQFGQPDLRAVVVKQADQVLAFLPFYVYQESSASERKLLLLGAGTTDYLSGVFGAKCTPDHVKAGMDCLLNSEGWDVMHAMQIRRDSPLFEYFQSHGIACVPAEPCSSVPAVTVKDLPTKIRRNFMYYRNKASRSGVLEVSIADASNCRETFESLVSLHTSRWRSAGEPGVLADPKVLAWHREAIPLLQESGLLRLNSLHLNGNVIAVLYSLIDAPDRPNRTQYIYLPALATAYGEFRPGTLMLALSIEHAAKEGVKTIDMLRGQESYKQIWHVEPVPTYGFSLPNLLASEACA